MKLACPNAKDEDIEKALKDAYAWGFVSKFKEGINEIVGAGGGKLSGG